MEAKPEEYELVELNCFLQGVLFKVPLIVKAKKI